ncbi:MAG TPA: zinc dependent phospholipase C family protein [Terriglobales bacterium]|nr:zinc dependent phospholipase C family protein [Terriglobales bacterium]
MRAAEENGGRERAFAKCRIALLILLIAIFPRSTSAYSVLTHEEIVDLAWRESIRPLLVARFPNATDQELIEAHSYAYGGCAIQDMGYYPFGHQFFSDLTHYVRTGDFVSNLFREARTLNEYAFAVGALSHYLGDNIGHSEAVNPSTAVNFPKLEKKYGRIVTYDESPHGHIRTEFAFDIDQLAKKRLAPPGYLERVGFNVPRHLVERAFQQTYGIDSHEVLGHVHPALRSYRHSVRSFIPAFAEAEVVLHGHDFPPDIDDPDFQLYIRRVQETSYERHWKKAFKGPGFRAHLLAGVVFVLPKVGPVSLLAIKIPDEQTQQWYVHSVNETVNRYEAILNGLKNDGKAPQLTDRDLDTGKKELPGAYRLTDKTYAELLKRITAKPDRELPPGIRENLLAFYSHPNAQQAWENEGHKWEPIARELEVLKQMKEREPADSSE